MGNSEGDLLTALLPIVVLFFIFYFLIIRPQQQQQKKHKEMVEALKSGDKIVTTGGLHATVKKVEKDFIKVALTKDVFVHLEKEFVSKKIELNNNEA
jgi:preprotein translocase subunit YajC